jgi:hypothetical protein
MKRTLITLTLIAAFATTAEARWKFPWNRDPIQQLLDPAQGIPILDKADLEAVHPILAPYIANGAGVKVKALDNCAIAILNHPEYLSSTAPPPAAATPPPAAVAGPISQIALDLAKADQGLRALQKKAALFAAPPPDDVVLACAPLEPSVGGLWRAIQNVFHAPTVTVPAVPTK